MAEIGFGLDDGGERSGSGAFGEGFFLLEKHEDGAGDLFVVDGDDFVYVAGDEGQSEVAGAADGNAVGDGGLRADGDGLAGLAGAQHGGELFGLDTDDANFGYWSP